MLKILSAMLSVLSCVVAHAGPDFDPIFKRPGPLVFAHRGGAGENPESTRQAFKHALHVAKADVLEIDIHATRDGKLVVWHGPSLSRVKIRGFADNPNKRPRKKRKIGEFSWDRELKSRAWVSFGETSLGKVPETRERALMRLEELLREFPKANLNIEMKNTIKARHLPAFIKLLDTYKNKRHFVIACTSYSILNKFRRATKGRYRTNMSIIEVAALHVGGRFFRRLSLKGLVLEAPHGRAYTPKRIVDKVRALGGRTYVFITPFINSRALDKTGNIAYEDIAEILDRGIDGIITDRPLKVRGLVDRWKKERLKKSKRPTVKEGEH
jgi:glycerophosphoryl diester phosphodiesterase